MADLAAGYMGVLVTPDINIRCTSFSLNSSQDLHFYNPVLGINDTLPSGDSTKGETPGTRQPNLRNIFRPGVVAVGGSFSYPATTSAIATFFDVAKSGDYLNNDKASVTKFQYYCKTGDNNTTQFTGCRINNFEFNAQAGEVVNISLDMGALDLSFSTLEETYIVPEKIITWDTVIVSTTPTLNHIRGVSFKINNNLSPIYTAGATDDTTLFPSDLRLGIQEVSGSVSFYLKQGQAFIPTKKGTADTINISCEGMNINATVFFQTTKAEGVVGPIICELPFVGVGNIFS